MSLLPDGPGPSKRDNGLPSAEWGALVDVDPRLSGALLDSLAAFGVPAYVEPARDVDTVSRATTHPKRPLDRLWVDPDREGQARDIVSAELADLTMLLAEEEPGATAHGLVRPVPRSAAARVLRPPVLPEPPTAPPVLDDDEVFRQIVAGFAAEAPDPVPRWPVIEDVDPTNRSGPHRRRRSDPSADPSAGSGTGAGTRPELASPGSDPDAELERPAALPGWLEPAPIEDEGHFVPPAPPPLPMIRPRTAGAVLMLLLGLVLVFGPGLVRLSDTSGVLLLGLVLTGGGASLLVWWMRDAPPTDSGPDDGAVV